MTLLHTLALLSCNGLSAHFAIWSITPQGMFMHIFITSLMAAAHALKEEALANIHTFVSAVCR